MGKRFEAGNENIPGMGTTWPLLMAEKVRNLNDLIVCIQLYFEIVITNNHATVAATGTAGFTTSDVFTALELFEDDEKIQRFEARGVNLSAYWFSGLSLVNNPALPGPIAAAGGTVTLRGYLRIPVGKIDALTPTDFGLTPTMLKEMHLDLTMNTVAALYTGGTDTVFTSGRVETSFIVIPSGIGAKMSGLPVIKEVDRSAVAGNSNYPLGTGRLMALIINNGNKTFGRAGLVAGASPWGNEDEMARIQFDARANRSKGTETQLVSTTLDGAFTFEGQNFSIIDVGIWDQKFGKIPHTNWSLDLDITALGGDTAISLMPCFAEYPADNNVVSLIGKVREDA